MGALPLIAHDQDHHLVKVLRTNICTHMNDAGATQASMYARHVFRCQRRAAGAPLLIRTYCVMIIQQYWQQARAYVHFAEPGATV
jgi:hypothetical protein